MADEQWGFDEFEEWWSQIKAYADEHNMSYSHVEEEFIIDGEFFPIELEYIEKDLDYEGLLECTFGSEYEAGIDYENE